MIKPSDIVDAILEEVKHWVTENKVSDRFLATWTNVESEDANLSTVTLPDGSILSGVPKLAHVTGLIAGNTVLCENADGNLPIVIVGKIVGDISAFGG